jgi:YD repeat-containing protein
MLGDPIKAVCEGLNGWFFGTIEYRCDPEGKKINGAIMQNGKRTGLIEYTYDVLNNLIKEHWQFGTVWSQTFIYEYLDFDFSKRIKYNSENIFLIDSPSSVKKEKYNFSNESGGAAEYFYNDLVKLENKTYEHAGGLKTTINYLYDNKGSLVKSYRKHSDGLTAVYSYDYDSLGRLANRTFTRPDQVFGSETYFYSDTGKLIRAHYKNKDMLLSGVITFEHDEYGKFARGHFVGDINFNAEVEFFYNQKNQLIQIFWQLTDGRTLTYIFEY